MEQNIRAALGGCIEDVLQKMFFVCSLGQSTADAEAGPMLTARLSFQGQPSGLFALRVSAAAARSIAADFLGEEESELSSRSVSEVVCEMANMICGSLLSRVESAASFRLSAPRIAESSEEWSAASATVSHGVELSNGVLAVMVTTERTTCREPAESVC